MRRQAKDWDKIIAKDIFDKRWFPKIYKEFLQRKKKKMNILCKKQAKDFIADTSPKKIYK